VEWRRTARDLRRSYLKVLEKLRKVQARLIDYGAEEPASQLHLLFGQVSRLVKVYESVAYAKPFVVISSSIMPMIPDEIQKLALGLD
jgi:hypothetical protein